MTKFFQPNIIQIPVCGKYTTLLFFRLRHIVVKVCHSGLPEVSVAFVFLVVALACSRRWGGLLHCLVPEANIRVLSVTPHTAVHTPG